MKTLMQPACGLRSIEHRQQRRNHQQAHAFGHGGDEHQKSQRRHVATPRQAKQAQEWRSVSSVEMTGHFDRQHI